MSRSAVRVVVAQCGGWSVDPGGSREADRSIKRGRCTMKLFNAVKKFVVSEDGPTAVEYAVMLALIVVVCLTAIQALGTNANARFNQVANTLQ
jgi:pilus assembly protein Flp/PilA